MEIRHLPFHHTAQLSQILDRNESWKSLMEEIPRDLTDMRSQNDMCKISRKYSAEHIQQIDAVSKKLDRSPTLILFDEWGTSGRKRATVGDLLELLKKVELFRAADFVAMDILKSQPPKRPERGPGARIDVTLPEEILDEKLIEEILKNAHYPNSSQLAAAIDSRINNNNRDYNQANVDRVKPIHFALSSDEAEQSDSDSHSDFIIFSAPNSTIDDAADINTQSQHTQQTIEPQEAVFSSSSKSASDVIGMSIENDQVDRSILVPDFGQLQVGNESTSLSNINDEPSMVIPSDSQFVPNLSILNGFASDSASNS